MQNLILLLLCIAAGYLLGSIPFGLVLTKLAGTEDLRSIGSGNIGATNVLRTGRKGLAAATLLLDALKGTAAVLIGRWLGGELAAILAGLAAFCGHLFPLWLGFKGGKGVATYLGVLLGFHWPLFLLFAGAWLATAYFTRLSSAAALTGSVLVPIAAMFTSGTVAAAVCVAMTVLLWWKHRSNIARLRAGTEPKIGQK